MPDSVADTAGLNAATTALAYDIKAFIGVTAHIELRAVNGIERSVGKARRVVDQRR
jgi:phenylacetate-CoA ligase